MAAYPVEGPIDVVSNGFSGALHEDLDVACMEALLLRREDVREHAMSYSWDAATQQFLQHLHYARSAAVGAVPAVAISESR